MDALQGVSEILSTSPDGLKDQQALRNRVQDAFRSTTTCLENRLYTELVAWYVSNKVHLGFDPHLGRFLLHPRPAVDAQVVWPTPANYIKSLGVRASKGEIAAVDDIADAKEIKKNLINRIKDEAHAGDEKALAIYKEF